MIRKLKYRLVWYLTANIRRKLEIKIVDMIDSQKRFVDHVGYEAEVYNKLKDMYVEQYKGILYLLDEYK